jgi:uncharacterized protein YceH (UPF0502 family)
VVLARDGTERQNTATEEICLKTTPEEKPLELQLNAVETRVLGSLLEKDITTPDYYPLTLNALLAACNQKSNREPVMDLDEAALRAALHGLEQKGLAGPARAEGRVARFEHRLAERLNLGRRETALLCTLLLRGAQTPGELRGRSERMHKIEDLDELQLVLQRLMEHDPPLARLLPRQPGTKEARYADTFNTDANKDTFAGADTDADGSTGAETSDGHGSDERVARLEAELAQVRVELDELRSEFAAFRRQFES